jgi:hypothetical protein
MAIRHATPKGQKVDCEAVMLTRLSSQPMHEKSKSQLLKPLNRIATLWLCMLGAM